MCGICGIFNYKSLKPIDEKLLHQMTEVLYHRGPDDVGFFIDGNIGLGNRRLIIQDLSEKGRQPMSNEDKTIWVTYNGEIYNFKELRSELEKKGHIFKSRTDTEVIIHCYEEDGIGCLNKFDGMFAFALWDKSQREFFLVRDRLGVKPLFYTILNNDSILFSSNINSILKHDGVKKLPEIEAISSYFSFRYPITEKTFFKGIYKLLPGQYMSIKDGKYEIVNYWDITYQRERKDRGENYYLQKVQQYLYESVRKRMISDVPICAYLSGGIDSSIIAAIMSGSSVQPIRTYSIGFKENNEFFYSNLVAKKFNTKHTEITITADEYFGAMAQLIKYKAEPLSVPNEISLYLMSKELKKDATVVLSGEGADEIFHGYGRIYRSPYDYQRLNFSLPQSIKNIIFNRLKSKYTNFSIQSEVDHFLSLYNYNPLYEKYGLFKEDVLNEIRATDEHLKEVFSRCFGKVSNLCYYEKIAYVFEKLHLPCLLSRLDNATMAAGVEGRVPFVDDHRLIEFVMNIPLQYKLRWKSLLHKIFSVTKPSSEISEKYDIPKYLLKKAFVDTLPNEIIARKKLAFPVPLEDWFSNGFNKLARDIILNKKSMIGDFFDLGKIEDLIDNFPRNRSSALKLWMLMNLSLWFQEYMS